MMNAARPVSPARLAAAGPQSSVPTDSSAIWEGEHERTHTYCLARDQASATLPPHVAHHPPARELPVTRRATTAARYGQRAGRIRQDDCAGAMAQRIHTTRRVGIAR